MKVLLANDQSPRAAECAHAIGRLPFPSQIDVTLMSVVTVPPMPSSVETHAKWPKIIDLMLEDAEASNAALVQELAHVDGTVESLVCRGDAAEEILNTATEVDADLLVLGALGHTAFERMRLGSVSDRIATHAECSTLIVRPPWSKTDASEPLSIVVALDESRPSTLALEEVSALKWPSETKITLLRVISNYDTPYYGVAPEMAGLWEEEREAAEKQLETVAAGLRECGLRVDTEVRTAAHHGEDICQRSTELDADIVVVGDHGYGAVRRFLLGSVSRYVLRHCKATVWIARHPHVVGDQET